MDFSLNDEQRQYADALRRWIGRDYGFEQRQAAIASASGISDAAWDTLAELGMLALPLPEQAGGFGGGAVDMHVVMRELGRALVVEPYLPTMMAAHILARAGVHGDILARVGAGACKLACAFGEPRGRHDMREVESTVVEAGGGYVLDGRKSAVIHARHAHALLVSARDAAGAIQLLLAPCDAAGVTVRSCRTLDGLSAAQVDFDGVRLEPGALVPGGWDLLEAGLDYGAGMLCAEALGAMEALQQATLDYLKTRSQFGVPIGKFQALQHRMADMAIHLEQAHSMALLAAVRLDGDDAAERRRAVSAAKFRIGRAGRFIGQQAVQLHGGMGVTEELPAAHYFKRLAMIELTLGDSDHHLQRFIGAAG
jgi:alkylation response protein AidB-like acyl-CoA dehydrogenase